MGEASHPYEVLGKYDLHPSSTAKEVRDIFPLSAEERRAYDALRYPDRRLLADYFLFQAWNKTGLAQLHQALRAGPGVPDGNALQATLEADYPVWLVNQGQRAAAMAQLRQLVGSRMVADSMSAHRLALLALADARGQDQRGAAVTDAWRLAIAAWAGSLADDVYWNEWCRRRWTIYGFVPPESEKLQEEARGRLREFLESELTGRPGGDEELRLAYAIEWRAARALQATRDKRSRPGAGWCDGLPVVGPLFLRMLGGADLGSRLSRFVADCQAAVDEHQRRDLIEALLDDRPPSVPAEVVRRLRLFFSVLAPAAAWLDLNQPRRTLAALPRPGLRPADRGVAYKDLEDPDRQFRRDRADLVVEAYLEVSRQHITARPANLPTAVDCWRRAVEAARPFDLERGIRRRITDLVLGRCLALEGEPEDAERMVELLERVREFADADEINGEMADALRTRAYWYFQDGRHIEAVRDLRRARQLKPDDYVIFNELGKELRNCALDCEERGLEDEALNLLSEAKSLLEQARPEGPIRLRSRPYNYPEEAGSIEDTLARVQIELDRLQRSNPNKAFDDLDAALQQVPDPVGGDLDAEVLLLSGQVKRRRQDYAGSIRDLEQALELRHGRAPAELAQTYADWGSALFDVGEPASRVREKIQQGETYNSENQALRKLKTDLEYALEELGYPP